MFIDNIGLIGGLNPSSATIWSARLTVRTPGFQPGNTSSILVQTTNKNVSKYTFLT